MAGDLTARILRRYLRVLAERQADLHPPLGKPGGPCQVVQRIDHQIRNEPLKRDLIDDVEHGADLSNSDASKVYPVSHDPGVGPFRQVRVTSHGQYRMDLRGITLDSVRAALNSFLKQLEAWKAQGNPAYARMSAMVEARDKIEWVDARTKLKIVFVSEGGGTVTLISAFWKGVPDPAPKFCGVPKTASEVAEEFALFVARRFQADAIGDPQELLRNYDLAVRHIADMESLIPKMREAQKIVEAHAGEDVQWKAHHGEYAPHENELITLYFKQITRFKVWVSLEGIKRANPWSLFLAILQQYDLPPTTRKIIELGAKFFAKSRIKAPSQEEAVDAYEEFLKTLRAFSMAAHDALAHGKPRAGGGDGAEIAPTPEKIKAGPFTLVNTGGFNDAVIANCAKVVEAAAHQLQSHGLGKVCYGDVLISNTLSKANILAFYLLQKDEMFVRANLKGKEGAAIETVVHELAHRLQYKFLSGKEKLIRDMYQRIANKANAARAEALDRVWKDPSLKPKPGDTFISKSGEEYEVSGFDVTPRSGITVQLRAKKQDIPGVTQKAKIPLEGYAAAKGILPVVHHSGFVTSYAGTDPDENFAEMVAFFCTGKLPEDQVEMLKEILA